MVTILLLRYPQRLVRREVEPHPQGKRVSAHPTASAGPWGCIHSALSKHALQRLGSRGRSNWMWKISRAGPPNTCCSTPRPTASMWAAATRPSPAGVAPHRRRPGHHRAGARRHAAYIGESAWARSSDLSTSSWTARTKPRSHQHAGLGLADFRVVPTSCSGYVGRRRTTIFDRYGADIQSQAHQPAGPACHDGNPLLR